MNCGHKKEAKRHLRRAEDFITPLEPEQVIRLWEGDPTLDDIRREYEMFMETTALNSTKVSFALRGGE